MKTKTHKFRITMTLTATVTTTLSQAKARELLSDWLSDDLDNTVRAGVLNDALRDAGDESDEGPDVEFASVKVGAK